MSHHLLMIIAERISSPIVFVFVLFFAMRKLHHWNDCRTTMTLIETVYLDCSFDPPLEWALILVISHFQ